MAVSELQLALLSAGVALVLAVWLYNFLQEQKHKKLAEKIFRGGQPDVLLTGQGDDERSEPSMSAPDEERIEPEVTPLAHEEPAAAPPPPTDWADDIADCTIRLDLVKTVATPALWAAQSAWAEQLSKPLGWMGYDETSAEWRRLSAHDAGHYSHLAAALQLADRQGAVGDTEIAIFLDGVHRLAQQFSGLVELPQAQDLLEHAQALDGFCANVDIQLAVNVAEAASGAFSGTKLRGLAEAAGLSLEDDGRFHARDDQGMELFTLANLGAELFEAESLKTLACHSITLVLDVPRVADGPAVFDRMVAAARQMAQTLDGALVDGQRHPLGDATIAAIRAKIVEIQRQMATNRIPPGSPRALRLFS